MRIGCLQFAPLPGEVGHNLSRADSVLLRSDARDLDLLVLPELAFAAQGLNSLNDVYSFLEPSGSGVTSMWARTVALKYGCTVVAGYAEKADVRSNWLGRPEYYNSTIAVNSNGETVAHYRKCYLQPSEEAWALEGPNPFHGEWLPDLGQVAIGTSMDINPYKFQDRWESLDFAFHVMEVRANLVIVTMAWPTHQDPRRFSRAPLDPDTNTLMYWISRLEPIIRAESEEEVIVVFCNKCGADGQNCYAGTSSVLGISKGEVRVYGILGRGTKELLVVDTEIAPFGRLVYCPDFDIHKEREAQMQAFLRPQLFHPVKEGHARAYSAEAQSLMDIMNIDSPLYLQSKSETPKGGLQSSGKTNSSFPSKTLPAPLSFKAGSLGSMGLAMIEPNILTPSAPSPTPNSVRPRFMIPPIESITQRYIVSQPTQSNTGYRHIPTPIPPDDDTIYSHPRILSGNHDINMQETPEFTPVNLTAHNHHNLTLTQEPIDLGYPLSAASEGTAFSDWFESELSCYTNVERCARVISGTNTSSHEARLFNKAEGFESLIRHSYTGQTIYRAPPSPPVHNSYATTDQRMASPISGSGRLGSRSGLPLEDYYTSYRRPTPVETYADTLLANHISNLSHQDDDKFINVEMKKVKRTNSFASIIQPRPRSASASLITNHNIQLFGTPNSGSKFRGRNLHRRTGKERGSSGRGQSGSNSRSAVRSRHRSVSQPVNLAQFKLIEEFPSPNCPVHGIAAREKARRSSSASRQQSEAKEFRSPLNATKHRMVSPKHKHSNSIEGVRSSPPKSMIDNTTKGKSSLAQRQDSPVVIPSISNSNTPYLTAPILERHKSPEVPWVETWMPPISKSVPPTSIVRNFKNSPTPPVSKTPPPLDGRVTPRAMVILFDEENANMTGEGGPRTLKCIERSASVGQYNRKTQVF